MAYERRQFSKTWAISKIPKPQEVTLEDGETVIILNVPNKGLFKYSGSDFRSWDGPKKGRELTDQEIDSGAIMPPSWLVED